MHLTVLKVAGAVLLCAIVAVVFLSYLWDVHLPSFKIEAPTGCACKKWLADEDPWIRALIQTAPQPFLTKSHRTSKDDFKWWQRLQRSSQDFTFYNATLKKLFEIIPPTPDEVSPGLCSCTSCALVGNSGNLIGSRYGSLINMHDVVIRMNHGRTKGFEADVGNRTTHHVMYPESAIKLDNTTRLVFFAFKIRDLLWLQNVLKPKSNDIHRVANKDLVMILNPAFMRHVHEAWMKKKGPYPSTGFLTIALSMHMCDEISIFGFGADHNGNWNHYFEPLVNSHLGTGLHAGKDEYNVIKELHKKQKVRFYVPGPVNRW